MLTEEVILQARNVLILAGLYVCPEPSRGCLINGGTHTERTPDLFVIHGTFSVEERNGAYLVQGAAHVPASFDTILEAVEHVVRFWKPIQPGTPLRRG